jgi:hypothetical protein
MKRVGHLKGERVACNDQRVELTHLATLRHFSILEGRDREVDHCE